MCKGIELWEYATGIMSISLPIPCTRIYQLQIDGSWCSAVLLPKFCECLGEERRWKRSGEITKISRSSHQMGQTPQYWKMLCCWLFQKHRMKENRMEKEHLLTVSCHRINANQRVSHQNVVEINLTLRPPLCAINFNSKKNHKNPIIFLWFKIGNCPTQHKSFENRKLALSCQGTYSRASWKWSSAWSRATLMSQPTANMEGQFCIRQVQRPLGSSQVVGRSTDVTAKDDSR